MVRGQNETVILSGKTTSIFVGPVGYFSETRVPRIHREREREREKSMRENK